MRILHGLPTSWDPSIMVKRRFYYVAWSPCSKFIVASYDVSSEQNMIEILDCATLQQLSVLKVPLGLTGWQIISPDSRLLTLFHTRPLHIRPDKLTTWDLQTGVQLSAAQLSDIPLELALAYPYHISLTYSECGTMVAAACWNAEVSITSIYNILSGVHLYSNRGKGILGRIWTHGECIRYPTFASRSIIIWEFGFASRHEPTQVESLSTPDNFHPEGGPLIHPTLSRLAFIDQGAVLVWDCQESQFLLEFWCNESHKQTSFSLDGHLFACGPIHQNIYLWKESPAGYVLHRRFKLDDASYSNWRISPDGGSVVGWGSGSLLRVWHTMDPATSLSNTVTQPPSLTKGHLVKFSLDGGSVVWQGNRPLLQAWHTMDLATSLFGTVTRPPPLTRRHLVGFSPDGVCAVITRFMDNVVTVLDLKSGDPWLVIDTSVNVHGLGVGMNTIVVVDQERIITWDLPTRNCAFNTGVNIDNSARITTFTPQSSQLSYSLPFKSPFPISPDLHHMVVFDKLYDLSTGQCLASFSVFLGADWFALSGHEFWSYRDDNKAEGWSIIKDSESSVTRLEHIGVTADPPGGFPWKSSHGYEVTDDGWVLSPSAKRLLWLPPYLRLDRTYRVWSGRFLVFSDPELSEPVLLELPVE